MNLPKFVCPSTHEQLTKKDNYLISLSGSSYEVLHDGKINFLGNSAVQNLKTQRDAFDKLKAFVKDKNIPHMLFAGQNQQHYDLDPEQRPRTSRFPQMGQALIRLGA